MRPDCGDCMRIILIILFFSFSSISSASWFSGYSNQSFDTFAGACSDGISWFKSSYPDYEVAQRFTNYTPPECSFSADIPSQNYYGSRTVGPFTLYADQCVTPGFVYDSATQDCYQPVDCSDTSTVFYSSGLGTASFNVCSGGCSFSIDTYQTNGINYQATYRRTGGNCSTDDATLTDNPPSDCQGTVLDGVCIKQDTPPGCVEYNSKLVCLDDTTDNCLIDSSGNTACYTDEKNCLNINGVISCADQSSQNCIYNSSGKTVCLSDVVKLTESTSTTTDQIDPDTTVTTTTQTINNNVQGDTSVTNSTSTTVFTDPVTGEQITTTEKLQSTGDGTKSDDENKTASGGLNCDAPPTCNGDAIMCWQLRMDWEQFCSINKPTQIDEDAIISDVKGDMTTSDLELPSVDFSTAINSNYFTFSNGSESCPADLNISILGQTYTYSYVPICDAANMLNPFVIFAGLISSIYILFRERA